MMGIEPNTQKTPRWEAALMRNRFVLLFIVLLCLPSVCVAQGFIPFTLPSRNDATRPDILKKELQRATAARLRRLEAFAGALQAWIIHTCKLTGDQQTRLKERCRQKIDASQAEWMRTGGASSDNGAYYDARPVDFVKRGGAADDVDLIHKDGIDETLAAMLTGDQMAALEKGVSDRLAFLSDSMISQAINILDNEFYLTSQQRNELRVVLKPRLAVVLEESPGRNAQYAEPVNAWVFKLIRTADELIALSELQIEWAKDIRGRGADFNYYGSQYMVNAQNLPSGKPWREELKELGHLQRGRISKAVQRCVAVAATGSELSAEDRQRIRLAGKGVADQVVTDWLRTERERLSAREETIQNGDPAEAQSLQSSQPIVWVRHVSVIEHSPLWHHTLSKLSDAGQKSFAVRQHARNRADAEALVAMMDREMWLTPSQRSELIGDVLKRLPDDGLSTSHGGYFPDQAMLVYLMYEASNQENFGGLTPLQQQIWTMMKGHITPSEDGLYQSPSVHLGWAFEVAK